MVHREMEKGAAGSRGEDPLPLRVGVLGGDPYDVEETFQLLKIPWAWYRQGEPFPVVIGAGGPVPAGTDAMDLPDPDLFSRISRLLNEGEDHCRQPEVEVLLDRLRSVLCRRMVLIEIPPVPWGHPWMAALTHDVDAMSLRERPPRSVLHVLGRTLGRGRPSGAVSGALACLGLGRDPWDLIPHWQELEARLGVRSTFFFLPFGGVSGIGSPAIRAGFYTPDPQLLKSLESGGWEAGIHGIDTWADAVKGATEVDVFRTMGIAEPGHRAHWLLLDAASWGKLEEEGISYDSSFGYNETIGYRAGTLQVYRPRGVKRILELPLHIQDMALFGRDCWSVSGAGWEKKGCLRLTEDTAAEACEEIYAAAGRFGGVVTLLWHTNSPGIPYCLDDFFSAQLERLRKEGVWIAPAREIVAWFRMRREVRPVCTLAGDEIHVHLGGFRYHPDLPPLCLRVHLPPGRISGVEGESRQAGNAVDIRCDRGDFTIRLAGAATGEAWLPGGKVPGC